jgi:hypothetical protein
LEYMFKVLKEQNRNWTIPYPGKMSFKHKGKINSKTNKT